MSTANHNGCDDTTPTSQLRPPAPTAPPSNKARSTVSSSSSSINKNKKDIITTTGNNNNPMHSDQQHSQQQQHDQQHQQLKEPVLPTTIATEFVVEADTESVEVSGLTMQEFNNAISSPLHNKDSNNNSRSSSVFQLTTTVHDANSASGCGNSIASGASDHSRPPSPLSVRSRANSTSSSLFNSLAASASKTTLEKMGDASSPSGASPCSAPRTPGNFLRHTPPEQKPSEGYALADARQAQKAHRPHVLALAPIITNVLVDSIERSIRTTQGDDPLGLSASSGQGSDTKDKREEEDEEPALPGFVAVEDTKEQQEARRPQPQQKRKQTTTKPQTSDPKFLHYETGGIDDSKALLVYVRYFMAETWSSAASFVGALILMDRFLTKHSPQTFSVEPDTKAPPLAAHGDDDDRPTFVLSYTNAFKLFATAALVSAKVVETVMCNNQTYASAARLPVRSMNRSEQRFLSEMDFDVAILRSEWEVYAERILSGLNTDVDH